MDQLFGLQHRNRVSLRECGVAICCVVSSVAEEALVAQILVQVLPVDAATE